MTTRGGPVVGLIVGSFLAAVGFAVTCWLGKPIRDQAAASVAGPSTEGRIIRSRLDRSHRDGSTSLTADIGYEYAVAGATHEGCRVWIGDDYSSSPGREFRAAVDRYPEGARVTVFYDPADPAESVLEPGATWSGSIVFLVGLGLLALGSLVALSSLVPLLLVFLAVAGWFAVRGRDPAADFDRPSSPPGAGNRSDGDDGITIT